MFLAIMYALFTFLTTIVAFYIGYSLSRIFILLLLPAIYALMVKLDYGLTGGSTAMTRKIGLSNINSRNSGVIDALLPGEDAW